MTSQITERLPTGLPGLHALLELGLDEDTRAVMQGARAIATGELTPAAARRMETDHAISPEIIAKLADAGILGALIPEQYGGSDLTPRQLCVIIEEISRGDASVGVMLSVSSGLVASAVLRLATEEQRRHLLPDLASGARIGSYQLSEGGAGSNPAFSLQCKARRCDRGWEVSGTKIWITSADLSVAGVDRCGRKRPKKGIGILFAIDPELERRAECTGHQRYRAIRAFLVDFEALAPGAVEVIAYEDKHGLRASATGQVRYSGAILPPDALLGGEEPGAGFKVALSLLSSGRLNIAAQSLGIHRAALEACMAYGLEREILPGTVMARNDLVRAQLADRFADYLRNRALTLQAAALVEHGVDVSTLAASAKLSASRDAQAATRYAMDFFGGSGFTTDNAVELLHRNAGVLTIYEGSTNTLLGILATALFGK